jgi:hypothetical protein
MATCLTCNLSIIEPNQSHYYSGHYYSGPVCNCTPQPRMQRKSDDYNNTDILPSEGLRIPKLDIIISKLNEILILLKK